MSEQTLTHDDVVPEDETTTDDAAPASTGDEPTSESSAKETKTDRRPRRQVTLSVPMLIAGLMIIALIASTVVFAVRDFSARGDLDAVRAEQADEAEAERVAGDYAVAAMTLDYQDVTAWITAAKKGVSPELARTLTAAGTAMEQVLPMMRIKSTADLITTSVTDADGDLFRVDATLNVNMSTIQNPSGSSQVSAFQVVMDRSKDWMITAVGDPAGNGPLDSIPGLPQPGAGQTDTPAPPAPAAPGTPAPAPAPGN
ncbi:hypothetical protein [Gordonia humi]|uniref:Mce-associated membrane protein n=1 Tax=Gordonia humi TaxID=686429 RepID=A0A840F1C9_9ACTN|nr:hypothetical protein [Gordonia humi]MBB4137671.1 Mce-associated membrane protein [Gordonia humi]